MHIEQPFKENELRDGSKSTREARLIELARQAGIGIRLVNGAGEEILANEQWRRITGESPRDAQNAGWLQRVHPEDRERVEREIRRSREQSTGYSLEHRVLDADGKITWVVAHAAPVADAAGRQAGTLIAIAEAGSHGDIEHHLINATLQAGAAIRQKIQLTPDLLRQTGTGESVSRGLRALLDEELSGARVSMHLLVILESSVRLKQTVDQLLHLWQINE